MKINRRDLIKFFSIVFSVLITFFVFASIIVYAFKNSKSEVPAQVFDVIETSNGEKITIEPPKVELENKEPEIAKKEKTNFLVVGTDNIAGLTDTILAGCFNPETDQIDLISVPRDTYMLLNDSTKKRIKEIGNSVISPSKINSIYSFSGGNKGGIPYLQDEIEELLNIKFDYYVIIDTEAFRKIIDKVGGIEYTLIRNYDYDDPLQDLHIHLKKGTQKLNGDQAEQLIRYRHDYANGDVQRIEVQHDFFKEFFRQVLKKETIMNNLFDYASIFISYVKTDFGLDDVPDYLPYIKSIKPENINFHILPGDSHYIGDISYFEHYKKQTAELVNDIFYRTHKDFEEPNSKDLKIQILNGSNTNGIANDKKDELRLKGYKNIEVGTYQNEKQDTTRINVKENGVGEDLVKFFDNPRVQVDKNVVDEGFDIIIIIGIDEK